MQFIRESSIDFKMNHFTVELSNVLILLPNRVGLSKASEGLCILKGKNQNSLVLEQMICELFLDKKELRADSPSGMCVRQAFCGLHGVLLVLQFLVGCAGERGATVQS